MLRFIHNINYSVIFKLIHLFDLVYVLNGVVIKYTYGIYEREFANFTHFFLRDYSASVLHNPVHKKYRKVSDHKNDRKNV